MNKSPDTERDIGIIACCDDKFRDLRHKALLDEKERHIKAKRNRQEVVPKFKIGERVVIATDASRDTRGYILVEILDFGTDWRDHLVYYGLVLKVSGEKHLPRLGRLAHFKDNGNWWGGDRIPANVHEDGVKWMENV